MDSILEAKELQIERKRFHVEFRENDRGKFLRITEEAHGRRNTIIVPSTGVEDVTAAIGEVLAGAENAPAYHFFGPYEPASAHQPRPLRHCVDSVRRGFIFPARR